MEAELEAQAWYYTSLLVSLISQAFITNRPQN